MATTWPTDTTLQPDVEERINGNELLLQAIHLMHEDDPDIYIPFALTWVQLTMRDLTETNRELRNRKKLDDIPDRLLVPADLEEEIPMEPELIQAAVYGVFLQVYAGEQSTPLYTLYEQKYELEKQKYRRNKLVFASDGLGW